MTLHGVQVLEPHFNDPKIRQVVGRSSRIGSHSHLLPEDRNVEVVHYEARPRGFLGIGTRSGVDAWLHKVGEEKEKGSKAISSLLHRNLFERWKERRRGRQ